MSKVSDYREALRNVQDLDAYLMAESGLPGPRGNLELAHAVASTIQSRTDIDRWLKLDATRAPVNSPEEYLAFCGVLSLGYLIARLATELASELRVFASDPRWRTREAVAMGLQAWGDADLPAMLAAVSDWSQGTYLEQRAAAAGICEPRLLKDPIIANVVLDTLDTITQSIAQAPDRRDEAFRTLRKGMAYCWSVAVAAFPEPGMARMESWCTSDDPDVKWVMRENLKKNRIRRIDESWIARMEAIVSARPSQR